MQPSSPQQHQHSPKRSSPLSKALSFPCDIPEIPAPSTPNSASNAFHKPPLTPPDSSSRSSASVASIASSPHAVSSRSSISLTSALSATAPQFHSRLLDAPIDIHQLASGVDSPLVGPKSDDLSSASSPDFTLLPGMASAATRASDAPSTMQSLPRPTNGPTLFSEPSVTAQARARDDDLRTPNVYINGLPPNFPEEQLFAMTRDFGEVLSVRTFTRHVSDKPSGYGFVLFGSVEAAEKCIETLRKYRNLHPSFSKQIHKIPGTVYATPSFGDSDDGHSQSSSGVGQRLPADSFKARMEQLKDTSSTNLYMEGLPLSIDEPTLSALVAPYRIMSNRFFQTKLSNPPRIIAFVRLETRKAAEEIIERLHGRLVRGWQDTGCRISVRFADTSEQREMRRTERVSRDGENSPSRLTMAQAALLNMKGAQLPRSPVETAFGLLPNGGNMDPTLLSDGFARGQMHGSGGSLSPLVHAAATLPFRQQQMINSLHDPALIYDAGDVYGDFSSSASHLQGLHSPQLLQDDLLSLHDSQTQLQLAMDMQSMAARADNGYTPMERLLLQAHAQRQQSQLLNTHRDVRGRPQVNVQSRGSASVSSGIGSNAREGQRHLLDVLPQISEDDFHASAGRSRTQQQRPFADFGVDRDSDSPCFNGSFRSALPRASVDQQTRLAHDLDRQLSFSQQQHQRNQTHAAQVRAEAEAQALHTRATTLPLQYLSGRDSSQTYTTGSAFNSSTSPSIANSTSISNVSSSFSSNGLHRLGSSNNRNAISTSANASTLVRNGTALRDRSSSLISAPTHSSTNSNTNANTNTNTSAMHADPSSIFTSKSNINMRSAHAHTQISTNTSSADEDDGLVSPALTYSTSTRTPATLSPATPFSGFFPCTGDTFEGPALGADLGGEKLKRAGSQ